MARKPATVANQETIAPIWKAAGDEFYRDIDFKNIADALGADIDDIVWHVTDEERDGVIGHTLSWEPI